MDLLNNIKKYDLKLCQILSHNKEDYLSYILRAYLRTSIHHHLLSYKKLENSDRSDDFIYGNYSDSLKYIGMTFPFAIGNSRTRIHVYKSLGVKSILPHNLRIRQKLEIRYSNTIIEFLEIWGYREYNSITEFLEIGGYRKYSQQSVYFIQENVQDLIWASHKDLSKDFVMKYEL